jgi:hypothetical protein
MNQQSDVHSDLRGRIVPGIRLVALLALVMASACAESSTTPAATAIPTATAAGAPTEAAATPTPPEATMAPTDTPATPTAPPATAAPTETPAASARYQLTFEATWSDATHPLEFPPNPHFSGLIGASHSPAVRLWEEGEPATPGIENMAETGGKSPLDSEIDALIGSGGACTTISGGGINPSPGVVTVTFIVSQDCPVVSVVSMIAPSPDWFVGVSALGLFEDGGWIEQRVVELFPYDAGTDSGTSYASPDEPTASPEPIYRIETAPLLIDGAVPPLGTFTFSRLDE